MLTDIKNRWKRHPFLDALIYRITKKYATYDTVRFNLWLFLQHPKQISQFAPIIIGGCPRSGTTLARALIGMHPEIASPTEEYNLLMWITKDKVLTTKLGLNKDTLETHKVRHLDLITRAETVLQMYLKQNNKPHIVLKHPLHIIILKRLFYHFPNMKFIHVIRDGRDVACSLRTHPKRRIHKGKIIPNPIHNPYKWCVRQWISCILQGQQYRDHPNYLEIKYEDLVNNTISTMKNVFSFLDLHMIDTELLLGFYKFEKDEKHLQNIEVGNPIYQKTIERWKKDLTKEEQDIFKEMTDDLLIKLGYVKDTTW
jgi:hypothetical protein